MAEVNTGTSGKLVVETSFVGNAAGNYSDVTYVVGLWEIASAPITHSGANVLVEITTLGLVVDAPFTFDWRPGGLQTQVLASGTERVYHNADGTPPASFGVLAAITDTGTASAGGPTSLFVPVSLATLKVIPGAPSACSAARVSDSAVTVSWAQSSASNGQPTSNTIRRRINGGSWADVATISPTTSAGLSAAVNQKLEYAVKAANTAGVSAWSGTSTAIFTTPAAPTGVTATKVGSDIQIAWTPNVAFTEHTHKVENSYSTDGGATWSGWSTLTSSVTAGTSTYTHTGPNASYQHKYRVSARNTATGNLTSSAVTSNTVVLLTAPNKPTVAAPAPFQDKAAIFRFGWTHNPVDTTAQTKYQYRYSTNGGSSWATTSSKTTSANPYHDFAANTWAANAAITFQVRTKGAYDSGSDGDASYSAWSDSITVTFKTKPVATITTPADSSTYVQAALTAVLGFSQAESATFVSARIGLYASGGVTLLEEIVSTTLAGTLFTTRLADGTSYVLKATVTDSNGITSAQVTSSFSVDYTEPVAAVVALTYLRESGIAQIGLTIPGAGGGLAAASTITIDRVIGGVSENVVTDYPSASSLTILDLTPTIYGDNLYHVTTKSVDGATTVVTATLTTAETMWAFMSKGADYTQIIRLGGKISPVAKPSVDSALVKTAGRVRPIGLYATTGDLEVTGVAEWATDFGSTPEEIEAFLMIAGKGCYRDSSGRRMFGRIAGQVSRESSDYGRFAYSVIETA